MVMAAARTWHGCHSTPRLLLYNSGKEVKFLKVNSCRAGSFCLWIFALSSLASDGWWKSLICQLELELLMFAGPLGSVTWVSVEVGYTVLLIWRVFLVGLQGVPSALWLQPGVEAAGQGVGFWWLRASACLRGA